MADQDQQLNFTIEQMDRIVKRCLAEEYQLFVAVFPQGNEPIHVTLEKGSSYGGMHMKFSAIGSDLLETANKAFANFPANPIGAAWDTNRLAPPSPPPEAPAANNIEDGTFVELAQETQDEYLSGIIKKTSDSKIDPNDDIPF